jgi:integrase
VASLQLRHSRTCKIGKTWTKQPDAKQAKPPGCTCDPSYTIVVSLEAGGRRSVGTNFSQAKKALAKAQSEQDAGTITIAPDKRFSEYVEEWLAALQRPGDTTIHSYRATVKYASEAFGAKRLRTIGGKDIEAFLAGMPKNVGQSTRAKHLRVLSGIFEAAVVQGLIGRNPVKLLPAQHRPQAERSEAAYFENDELPRLISELEGNDRHLVRLAVMTGLRAGELIALEWGAVDLGEREIHVKRAWKDQFGVGTPKSKSSVRTVLLTDNAVSVLEDLVRKHAGFPADDELVFPGQSEDGYRRGWQLTKVLLHPAMKRAGISNHRTFHSLRHTFARIAFESGASVGWVSRQLGHSSTSVTEKRYEHWSKEARKRESSKLEGAFTL